MFDQGFLGLGISAVAEGFLLEGRGEQVVSLIEQDLEVSRTQTQRGVMARCLRLLGDIALPHDPTGAHQAEAS